MVRPGELVVRPAGNDADVQLLDAFRIEDRAQRIRAEHIGLDLHDAVGTDGLGAQFVGQLLRTVGSDVRQGQLRALGREQPGETAADA
ncbi:unnamed protein product, partial [Alternaria burnsii]